MSRDGRAGVGLMEALVALLLGLVVVLGALSVGARVRVVHQDLVERADNLASVRLAAYLLRTETETAEYGVDWNVHDDSLSLRAFRGTGIVCAGTSTVDAIAVSYTGYRRPDPSKDSLVVIGASGERTVVALAGVGAGPDTCGAEPLEGGLVLRSSAAVPSDGVVVRVFERGAYSVSAAALRYRRGASGRQPLTAEVFDGASGWRPTPQGLELELLERGSGGVVAGAEAAAGRWRLAVSPRWLP
jgi:Tfp pilus assembly protein PilW